MCAWVGFGLFVKPTVLQFTQQGQKYSGKPRELGGKEDSVWDTLALGSSQLSRSKLQILLAQFFIFQLSKIISYWESQEVRSETPESYFDLTASNPGRWMAGLGNL